MPMYQDPGADCAAKARKTACLDALGQTAFQSAELLAAFPAELCGAFFAMVDRNLFRPIPATSAKLICADAEPVMVDVARDHIVRVYPLLAQFFRANPGDAHFAAPFQRRFLQLMHAPDAAEREHVVAFAREWVARFPDRERSVWEWMAERLVEYRQGMLDPFAVPAILSFFAVRFKESLPDLLELRDAILRKSIIPLKSGMHLLSYIPKMTAILDIFIEIDQSFATEMVCSLIASFPRGRLAKQVPYIQWIIATTEKVPLADFPNLCPTLFSFLADMVRQCSSKVVETSCKIFQNLKIIPLIIDNTHLIYPVMLAALNQTVTDHWKLATQNYAFSTIRAMQDLDPAQFDGLKGPPKKKKKVKSPPPPSETDQKSHKIWAAIVRRAGQLDPSLPAVKLLAMLANEFGPNGVQKGLGW
jgi:hypothetical protein